MINAINGSSARIGTPLRQEQEFQYGETIVLTVKIPGGTVGRTFVSNFRHELAGKSNQPVGQVQGSFAITVLDRESIQLSTVTDGLALGRYHYDISFTDGSIRSTSSVREFLLLSSLSSSPWQADGSPTVLPPVSTYPELIEQHNDDLNAHNGLLLRSQQFTVANEDLLGSYAVLTHDLNTVSLSVTVSDSQGGLVLPWHAPNAGTVQIDFSGLTPLQDLYRVLLIR